MTDFNNQQKRKEINQETRQWIRKWDVHQREMVLWILEEEVRDDKLMNFEHEDGGTTKSEKLN